MWRMMRCWVPVVVVGLVSCGTTNTAVRSGEQGSAAPAGGTTNSDAAPSTDRALLFSGLDITDGKGTRVASGFDLPPAAPGGPELSPIVVPYGNGSLYLAATPKSTSPPIPELRLTGGSDEVIVAATAFSVAVSAFGAIATAEPATGSTLAWTSDVIVRTSPASPPKVWSLEAANYAVLAWAADVLLVIKNPGESGEPIEFLAFDGPGEVRVLNPNAGLIAVSPDGRWVLLSTSAVDGNGAELVDPSTGKDVGVVDTSMESETVVVGQGSWSSSGLVASIWVGSEQRLGLFTQGEAGLTLTKSVTLPTNVLYGLNEPYALGTPGHVTGSGWARNADIRPRQDGSYDTTPYMHVVCDFTLNQCKSTAVGDPSYQIGRERNPSGGESEQFQLISEQR